MALRGNGQLLTRVQAGARPALAEMMPSHDFQPLSPAQHAMALAAGAGAHVWMLGRPAAAAAARAPIHANPWNAAHAAASAAGYAHYVEPDILHARQAPSAPPAGVARAAAVALPPAAPPLADGTPQGILFGGLQPDYPPFNLHDGVSPGWHLLPDYTGFRTAWQQATGRGVRIAHLDTGYTPAHYSTPRNMRPALNWDFWRNSHDATDPGDNFLGIEQPGHGTATLALLAGAPMDLAFGQRYVGPVGGAPDAEVFEVRIGPTVYHVYSSTMASGIYYALNPSGDPSHPDPANRCDVISISHGGLPTMAWADAVNAAYEAGVVIVAASGDHFDEGIVDLPTHFTVWPSAFNRVLTSVGATFDKKAYTTDKRGVMQGSWGPDDVMAKAAAAFTPNVFWMMYDRTPGGFEMSGGGTSASTPQMAAACALWLQAYGGRLAPADWRRVEACRLAMLKGADKSRGNTAQLGQGLLDVPQMLRADIADDLIAKATAHPPQIAPSVKDSVSFPFWRLLVGAGPSDGDAEAQMYETEVAQVVLDSGNRELLAGMARAMAPDAAFTDAEKAHLRAVLAQQDISDALRRRIG